MAKDNYIGKKYNKLTVLRFIEKNKNYKHIYEVQCDCEKQTIFNADIYKVETGHTKSCGCLKTLGIKKYNTYDLTGEYGIGYDYKGEPFYFDLEDYDKIKDICWNISGDFRVSSTFYINKKKKNIELSKFLTNTSSEMIDHINLNPRDNRRGNLRPSDKSKNAMNTKGHGKLAKFGVKGVYWNKINKNWNVGFTHNTQKYNGTFKDIKDAISKRIELEKEYFGEHRYVWENDIVWDELLEYERELKTNLIKGE